MNRRRDDDERPVADERSDERPDDRPGPAPGLVRALVTLIGLAGAGLLVWIASTFSLRETGEFWIAMALIAAAGLILGLSQLLGGWTKWGWPRFSPSVFLFAFVPTLVIAGGMLLAMRPAGEETEQVRGWADDLGIGGLVEDFLEFPGLLALAIGLVLAFCFDTSGRRVRAVRGDEDVRDDRATERRRAAAAGPPPRTTDRAVDTRTTAERDVDTRATADRTDSSDRTVAEELGERRDRTETVGAAPRDERRDDERRSV